ncbi:GNAT family N-acetyltransferase [Myroides sp. LJL115]
MKLEDIITDRLYLFPLTIELCKELFHGDSCLLEKHSLKRSFNWPATDMLEALERIIINLQKVAQPSGFESWLIVKKDTSTIIGDIGFKGQSNKKGEIDIGYGITKQERQKAYTSEAARGLIQWAFSKESVIVITTKTLISNLASARTLESFGFKENGVHGDVILWSLERKSLKI